MLYYDENENENESFIYQQYLDNERQRNYDSYPTGTEHIYCSKCGELLRYNSMSYHEGFHIDSCD
jgi:hypothetical protein